MKTAEIKELSNTELEERIAAEVAQLEQLKINHAISPLDSPAKIKVHRKTSARMKTELRERELNKK